MAAMLKEKKGGIDAISGPFFFFSFSHYLNDIVFLIESRQNDVFWHEGIGKHKRNALIFFFLVLFLLGPHFRIFFSILQKNLILNFQPPKLQKISKIFLFQVVSIWPLSQISLIFTFEPQVLGNFKIALFKFNSKLLEF